jgi:alpha-ribazole phosphatase
LAQPAPGGEDPVGFADRIEAALAQLVATRDPGPILVATHAGVIRTAIARACAVPFAMLWSMRIDYGTRVRLKIGLGADGQLWGELRELVQPVERP